MTAPDSARHARDAAEAIGARFEDLDQGGGYLFRISKGRRFVLGGGGGVCTYPVNSASAYTVSRDKSHTKSVLAAAGLAVIPGALFFAHTRRLALRGPGREVADALQYADEIGYPVFCKPNVGARGTYAEIVHNAAALEDYARRVATDFESFLVEILQIGAEHRVFVQDGRVVFHSTKAAPELIGNGAATLGQLLDRFNADVVREGVSALPPSVIGARDPSEILPAGAQFAIPGRRNLSAAGGVETVSEHVPEALARLAIAAVAALGLRIGAVDLFDISPERNLSDLVIIEVNGNPGLRTLELAGRSDLIRGIWVSMLNACLDD